MLYMLYITSAVLFFFMTLWFLVSLVIKRNDIADVLWGAGFVVIVLTALMTVEMVSLRALVMCLLVVFWGGCLSTRVFLRYRGKPEDFRYRRRRKEWGGYFALRSYFQIFVLQGVLMFVVLAPVLYTIGRAGRPEVTTFDILGILVWCGGFIIEAVADFQLDSFKQRSYNKGRILTTGLWKYSRHPNYFGEVVMWWGIYTMALSVSGGLYTIIGPVSITFLILCVSGIPLIEERYRDNLEYREYKKRTSGFIPLPPRDHTE